MENFAIGISCKKRRPPLYARAMQDEEVGKRKKTQGMNQTRRKAKGREPEGGKENNVLLGGKRKPKQAEKGRQLAGGGGGGHPKMSHPHRPPPVLKPALAHSL